MPDYLSAADVCLVPLRRLELFKGVLPTKMFDAWACETPAVVGVEGEARALAEEVGAGIYVEPDNPRALADLLLELSDRPDWLQHMGPAGRRAVLAKYSLQAAAQSVEATLDEVVTERMHSSVRPS
jgi:glycosyltransferase involved in cell wall biosynthesis